MGLYDRGVFVTAILFAFGVFCWFNIPRENLKPLKTGSFQYRASMKKPREKVAITTICVDSTEFGVEEVGEGTANLYRDITMDNHKQYAAMHGYDYFPVTKPLAQFKGTNISDVRWHKSFVVQDLLLRYDWVFWSDCDAMFMNFTMPLPIPREIVPSFHVAVPHMIIIGDNYQAINSGQFLIDNSQWSKNFLDQIHIARPPSNRDRRHNCGQDTKDNPVFNWLLWGNCTVSSGSGSTLALCQAQVNRSLFPNELGCFEFNTYPRSYNGMSPERRSSVYRVHVPGNQNDKVKFVNAFKHVVSTDGGPVSAKFVWPIN